MKTFLNFTKFYLGQLFKKMWIYLGFLPTVIDGIVLWLQVDDKYLSNPIYQKFILLRWKILLGFLLFAHARIIYQLWKQSKNDVFQPILPNEGLSLKQENFSGFIKRVLKNQEAFSSFLSRYKSGSKYLNSDIPCAASDYNAAFHQIKEIFLERSTYNNGSPNEQLIKNLEDGINKLKYFSDESKNNESQLREIISDLEGTFKSLSAYISL